MCDDFNIIGQLDDMFNMNLRNPLPSLSNGSSMEDIDNLLEPISKPTTRQKKKTTKKTEKPKRTAARKSQPSVRRSSSPDVGPQCAYSENKNDDDEVVPVPVPVPMTKPAQRKPRAPRRSKNAAAKPAEESTVVDIVIEDSPPKRRRGRRSKNVLHAASSPIVLSDTENPRSTRSTARSAQHTFINEWRQNLQNLKALTQQITATSDVINIDTDSDDGKGTDAIATTALDDTFDEENPILSVKVCWKNKPEIFELRKYQKFAHIFNRMAEHKNMDVNSLVFSLNDNIISADDTPDSIDYKIYEFISAQVLVGASKTRPVRAPNKQRDKNEITVKVQSANKKQTILVDLLKTDKLKILYIKCGEELNIPYENIILDFDGDHLNYNDTPQDCDIEGGEVIDLRIKH